MTITEAQGRTDDILSAVGITKSFGRTRALDGASLRLGRGEIHALIGANGAGKSTLSKVISGHLVPDAGELIYQGAPLRLRSTRDALDAGIAMVMQETSLVPDLSVAENIFLPELAQPGRFSYASLYRRGADLLATLGQQDVLALDIKVRELSAAQRQLVEIAKALSVQAKLIIFDEPTASLSPSEVERLFDIMIRLRDQGSALVFVSHRLEEVFDVTDHVTVLREGRTVLASHPTANLSQGELIRAMVGHDLAAIYEHPHVAVTPVMPVALEVCGLSAPPLVHNVSFRVHEGEILGLGGLVGAGRSEAVEAIFGLRPRSAGTMTMQGRLIDPRSPAEAVRAGMGFVAEDRRTQNIVPHLSVKENLLLAHLGTHKGFGLGYRGRERQIAVLLQSLGLPADRLLDANMLNFSGGMQQKIIIARWLLLEPRVLILDEPTKGVDIGTRASIYALLRDITAKGTAVIVISSDFEELLGVADRIVVISDGISVANLPSALLDKEKLTLLAAPRTSMARNTALLRELSTETGGTGFWALLDADRLICLNLVTRDSGSGPGFAAGDAKTFGETLIPQALARRAPTLVTESSGSHTTMLCPLQSRRGHNLGWIGLTMTTATKLPSPASIQSRVAALADTL